MSNEIRVCGYVLPADGPLPALNRRREAMGLQPLWTRPMTRAERAVFEPVEPRCRVCRNPEVRHLVNGLLDWRRVPVLVDGGKTHRITLSDILRGLDSLNEVLDPCDRITYDSLWVHTRRHYDIKGVAAYWSARIRDEFVRALRGHRGG